ncbi:MAG TPA: hypothetical protein IGR64_18990 [Leptolyngbyaceae cyanobacterium M65_K2018_010]|nr:hypothetical protein [Leptolyngbyaceae cyanobacterium M65_K2018_010]
MSQQLARQLVRYRNLLVALANAAITWVILIIAPLGLFAVIVCTVLVFLASLATGFLGDLAFVTLLDSVDPRLAQMVRDNFSVTIPRESRGQPQIDPPRRQVLPREED